MNFRSDDNTFRTRFMKSFKHSLLFVLICGFCVFIIFTRIVINPTPSAPIGYYWKCLSSKNIKVGDWILMDNPYPDFVDARGLIKRVEKIENDKVWLGGQSDTYIASYYGIDENSAHSFDSNYFGWVEKSKLNKLVLLFAEEKED